MTSASSLDLNINSLSTALLLLSENYRIRRVNTATEQLLGFSNRQLESETFFELIKGELSPSDLDNFREQQLTGFIEDIELKVATGVIHVNLMVTPYSDGADNQLLLEIQSSAHHQNIRKDLQLQQQSRVSENLVRNLAHEIKNPLGGIKGAAQLLERKLPVDFPKKYSQIIINEADRLGALVDRLLMPAIPEATQSINPHQLIENALEIVLLQSSPKFKVVKDYDPSLPDLKISPNQIMQALLNLIKNAAEAIQLDNHQDPDGCLTLRTRMLHQHAIGQVQYRQVIKIDVEDNGIGVPHDLVSDIFFPTISGKQSSGLGLSIAQSLVQRHKGIIELETFSGKTCFSLYLPVKK